MSKGGRFKEFVNRNIISLVMVPVIILIHVGWNKIQDNELLMKKEDKKELPIVLGWRKMKELYIDPTLEGKFSTK